MRQKRWIATFVALLIFVTGWIAGVQLALAKDGGELAAKYARLAGSEANARILVDGLSEGASFSIGEVAFTPPTGKMDFENVDLSLALADAKLKEQGVSAPTAAQLKSALIGDAEHPGVLALRAEGRGWRRVAQAMHLKVGDVVRAAH
jgi:hypothetical protein